MISRALHLDVFDQPAQAPGNQSADFDGDLFLYLPDFLCYRKN